MGVFALPKLGRRLFSPRPWLLGTGLLAFIVMSPTAGEARVGSVQLGGAVKECSAQPIPGNEAIPGRYACLREGAVLAKAAPPLPRFSGKLGDDLAAELYCRTLQTEISEITRRSIAVLPYPASRRLIEADANIDVEWPHGGFEAAPDTGIIETLGVARLPDG